jgi:hypothetical protein
VLRLDPFQLKLRTSISHRCIQIRVADIQLLAEQAIVRYITPRGRLVEVAH